MSKTAASTASIFRQLSQPARIEILMAIGEGEACVCHLEAKLGRRQAYISQHLMALRDAGMLSARRDGRFIYYRLSDPLLMDLIRQAALLAGVPEDQVRFALPGDQPDGCACPICAPEGELAESARLAGLLPLEEVK